MKEPQTPLSFELLHKRVEQYIKQSSRELPGIVERVMFWIGWAGAGLGLLVASTTPRWITPEFALPVVRVGLGIEVAGFAVSIGLMLKREVPKLWQARRQHAEEMDADFRSYRKMVDWLQQYPHGDRLERLRFVQSLRTNMSYRLGLALGGVERLGVLPVLIALYLQFKGWEWGNWDALADVNLVGGLLIWAMVLLYGVGWMAIGLKVRLDTYESLLGESLQAKGAS